MPDLRGLQRARGPAHADGVGTDGSAERRGLRRRRSRPRPAPRRLRAQSCTLEARSVASPARQPGSNAVTLGALVADVTRSSPLDASSGADVRGRPSRSGRHGVTLRLARGRARRPLRRAARPARRRRDVRARRRRAAAPSLSSPSRAPARCRRAVAPGRPTPGWRSPRSRPRFYGHPSEQLTLVGVTGTNGKTTTTYLLAGDLRRRGRRAAAGIGTVGYRDRRPRARRGAHDAGGAGPAAHAARDGRSQGCGACAMEVSSHALALHRVDYCASPPPIFTNLTRDHLDFHGDMEDYFAAKRRLFELLPPARAGDHQPRRSARRASSPRRARTAGDLRDRRGRRRHARPAHRSSLEGLAFEAATRRAAPLQIRSSLVGRPNVYNILAAVADGDGARSAVRRDRDGRRRADARARPLPGRVERRRRRRASSSTTPTPTTR